MKIILLSGGSGKRLWPLSNETRSKQFLKVLQSPTNEIESMIQRVWRQLGASHLQHNTYISTSAAQIDLIEDQLGADVSLIIEPLRRDTFPAISLAITYIHSVVGVSRDEVITVVPVDLYVDNSFFSIVKKLEHCIGQSGADIALIGVKPNFPSTNYGYIIPRDHNNGSKHSEYFNVQQFIEKPTEKTSQQLIKQHALWNCGVFAFKLGYMLDQLKHKGYPIHYIEFIQQYSNHPKISFDYEILEKAQRIVVIPYLGKWRDLGSWSTLTETIEANVMGRGLICDNCNDVHIMNELNIPIIASGVSDLIIAASPDGIFVANKNNSDDIKEILNNEHVRSLIQAKRKSF